MKDFYRPAIVVVAFNRTHTLQRILGSIQRAVCPEETKLIISIDNNGQNQEVADIARSFVWKCGEKDVIYHNEHMGMIKHFSFCGNLSNEYGSIILLEDDMVVSPYFYQFSQQSLNYYKDSDEIIGISLYNLPYTEATKLSFIPLHDNADVYFSQVPCTLSWAYSNKHWDRFMKWFEMEPDLTKIEGLPLVVHQYWSKASFKKYLYGYMVENDKYFVYPNKSYSTNFNDLGTHMAGNSFMGQVSLQMASKKIEFKSIRESMVVYDAYSEIIPNRLNRLTDILSDYDYEVDLYGQKESFSKEYVLTSKPCNNVIKGFKRAMKPHELNIVYNIKGEDFKLAKSADVRFSIQYVKDIIFKTQSAEDFNDLFNYYYTNVPDTRILVKILLSRIKNRIRGFFGKR